MLNQVHEHIVSELQQNARTDTIFVVTAIVFNLIVLGINSAVAGEAGLPTKEPKLDWSRLSQATDQRRITEAERKRAAPEQGEDPGNGL